MFLNSTMAIPALSLTTLALVAVRIIGSAFVFYRTNVIIYENNHLRTGTDKGNPTV